MVDAHIDANALRDLRRVRPELYRLTEASSLDKIVTISVDKERMVLWSGAPSVEATAFELSEIEQLCVSQTEIDGRPYAALEIRVRSEGEVERVRLALSMTASSGLRKLAGDDIQELISDIAAL